jgi:protein-S-isoprenylcysteine O-methyltransferase Ste14
MQLILWPFVIFLVFWTLELFNVKKTVERKRIFTGYDRLFIGLFILIAFILVFLVSSLHLFNTAIIPTSIFSQSIGFIIEVLGLLFAVWARIVLGRNWSASVTFKEKHELITQGSYAIVRHPIYTGMTAMFLGAAIYLGFAGGFILVIIFLAGFLLKARQEEKMMTKHFPKKYKKYKKNTKMIIPFIY